MPDESQPAKKISTELIALQRCLWKNQSRSAAGTFLHDEDTLLVAIWAVLLTNIVLIRFRKLPFTCTLPVLKQHSFVILLSIGFGFLLYAGSTPEFESVALTEPLRMISLAPVAAVMWYIPRYFAKNAIDIDRKLIFEESPTQTVEALRFGDYGR